MKTTVIKCVIMLGLIIVLSVILSLVSGIISERARYKKEVIDEISNNFGGVQKLTLPLMQVEYYTNVYHNENGNLIPAVKHFKEIFAPQELDVSSDVIVQLKKRSLYKATVYNSESVITGRFVIPQNLLDTLSDPNVTLKKISFVFAVSDRKGLYKIPNGKINGVDLNFDIVGYNTLGSDYLDANDDENYGQLYKNLINGIDFTLNFYSNGTKGLYFIPTGLETNVLLRSNWPDPSFKGDVLPVKSDISGAGFSAEWLSSWISGHFIGTHSITSTQNVGGYSFGVEFLELSDNYILSDKAVKYGFLVIALTFAVIFVIEYTFRLRIHPIQYFLVGFAVAVFFLLLLSLSEYMSFTLAYLSGAFACVALITGYSYSMFRRPNIAYAFGGFEVLLLLVLYILLNMTEFALIVGSIFIFIVLAAVMFFTRNVDWFDQ